MENLENMNQISSDIYTIGISADGAAREGFLDAGVDVFFEKDIALTKNLLDTLVEQDAKKILFIDDCQYLRKPMQTILSNKLGVDKEDILTAENPLEANKIIIDRDFVPDVVITDNEMPKMNGIPFVKFLRTGEEPDLSTKIIAISWIIVDPLIASDTFIISSSGRSEVEQDFLDAGADIFLSKPFDLAKLKGVVQGQIDKKGDIDSFKVLIMEDDTLIGMMNGDILEMMGIAAENIVWVKSSGEAKSLLKKSGFKPDLIITDNDMDSHNEGIASVDEIRRGLF